MFCFCVCINCLKSAKKKFKRLKINRRDLETESDYDNWAQIFDKYNPRKTKIQTRINF